MITDTLICMSLPNEFKYIYLDVYRYRVEDIPHDILQFMCTWKRKKIDLIFQIDIQTVYLVLVQFQNEKNQINQFVF